MTQWMMAPRHPSTIPHAGSKAGRAATRTVRAPPGMRATAWRISPTDSPRNDSAPQEAVAREALVEPEQALADPKTMGMGDRIAGVVGDHAEVGHVIVEPLHLQEHHAEITRSLRHRGAGRGLQGLAEGQGVAHGGVAGHALGQLHALGGLPTLEELLGTLAGEV